MNLIFAMVLVAQLDGVEGVKCGRGEYPVGAECCPMCGAGLRVYKHCTASSSTTCIPCVADTYTDHPNGLERCMDCKLCDKGANLVPEVACTYTKNTVCGCPPGYFCSYFGTEDCELCQHYTVCFPDSMVKVKGTKTTDNVCEACPPGTFSTANMPYNCTSQSTRQEDGLVQGEGRNTPSAAVFVVPVVVVALLVATASLAYIWQRRRRKSRVPPVQESGGGQQGQALILTTDSRDQTTVPVQETCDDPEETRSE
ncbi:tumor necrosis factor receptor superfamily member 14 [Rissa tridactyla]|uniref:tumor necrosis factor receptor superfamily member 14 n=1 Tax=Rissa tridactyla TaxID=75485 RepID=UPI0023BA5AEC|nr:tumor necrosis factor receptor superfamily member 14 [Rissa tridactyla]